MSPRRTATQEVRDPLERILDKMERIEDRITAMEQTLERRLGPVESAMGSISDHETRIKRLEERLAEARGAAWATRVLWIVVTTLAGAAGWAISNLLHH